MSENTIPSGDPAKPAASGASGVPQFFVDLAKNAPAMMWVFTITTFLSALLLFAIQPMFAKMVLPVLGGSPSVWSVSVFFFQGALLAGYIYAHLLINKAPPHLTGVIHLGVCLLAVICLPIGLSTRWGEPPQGEPYFWQLAVFTASIGLPFMAVSANAPLLQAWFARSGHPNARDPYFLYAASNLGSLIALLGYPFILEPAFGLSQLSHLWAYAYRAAHYRARWVLLPDARSTGGRRAGDGRFAFGCRSCSPAADAAAPPGLGRTGLRSVRARDSLHRARHHRRRFRAAAVGASRWRSTC